MGTTDTLGRILASASWSSRSVMEFVRGKFLCLAWAMLLFSSASRLVGESPLRCLLDFVRYFCVFLVSTTWTTGERLWSRGTEDVELWRFALVGEPGELEYSERRSRLFASTTRCLVRSMRFERRSNGESGAISITTGLLRREQFGRTDLMFGAVLSSQKISILALSSSFVGVLLPLTMFLTKWIGDLPGSFSGDFLGLVAMVNAYREESWWFRFAAAHLRPKTRLQQSPSKKNSEHSNQSSLGRSSTRFSRQRSNVPLYADHTNSNPIYLVRKFRISVGAIFGQS